MKNSDIMINVKGLNKSFDQKPAVVDLSLAVKKGEVFGFLGPNGSGKTTTIRMLCGLLTPDSGEGLCLGYDLIKESYKIKRHVGYMAQRFSLYDDLTIAENLDFVAELYQVKHAKEAVEKSMESIGLQDHRHQITGTLSGGWKQRLALAAALIHDPDILLLDEPTAGVDPTARHQFWDQIHQLAMEGMTVLVSTHYMDEVERCTRLACIAHGRLFTEGTAEEIVAQSGLFTWAVFSDQLLQRASELRKMPGVDQVVTFATKLHVSGQNDALLEETMHRLPANVKVEKIAPSLEDVFITLVGKAGQS